MNVFVWKSHGEVKVCALNTTTRAEIISCLMSEGFEVDSERSWAEIQDAVFDAQESGSDMFEYGTGIVKVEGEADGKY